MLEMPRHGVPAPTNQLVRSQSDDGDAREAEARGGMSLAEQIAVLRNQKASVEGVIAREDDRVSALRIHLNTL